MLVKDVMTTTPVTVTGGPRVKGALGPAHVEDVMTPHAITVRPETEARLVASTVAGVVEVVLA